MNIADECRRLIERGTKPTLPDVRPIIDAWYARPENGAGGELHVILDDCNMEQHFLIDGVTRDDYSDDAKYICAVLLMLSPSQRRRL